MGWTNPLADPCSAPNTVLLFEGRGGWNQAGGSELLTTGYHTACNMLFVDGSIGIVGPEQIASLNWAGERKPP